MTPGAPHPMGRWQLRRLPLGKNIRGVAMIEAAIALPAYLALLFGIIDLSMIIVKKVQLDRATLVAARCAAVRTAQCLTPPQIKAYAASKSVPFAVSADSFSLPSDSCGIRVTGSMTHNFFFAQGALGSITVSASSCLLRTDINPIP